MRDPSAQGLRKILSRDRLPVKSWLHDDEFFVSFVLLCLKVFSARANFLQTVQHSRKYFFTTARFRGSKFPLLNPPPRGAGEERGGGSEVIAKATKGLDIFDYKLHALRFLRGQICFSFSVAASPRLALRG